MDPSRRGVTTTSLAPVSFLASTTVDLARIQFATTSLYHFLFVPLTLGLAPFVAVMQTLWHRTGEVAWLRLTRFFGTLMLINFAIGVATGLVQEFQFGMNWSVYSKYVGDVFGAPLAIEGLAAFFLERGVLLRPLGNTIYVMPPYCVTAADLDLVYSAIADAADTVK